jgi:hypothetical protein
VKVVVHTIGAAAVGTQALHAIFWRRRGRGRRVGGPCERARVRAFNGALRRVERAGLHSRSEDGTETQLLRSLRVMPSKLRM